MTLCPLCPLPEPVSCDPHTPQQLPPLLCALNLKVPYKAVCVSSLRYGVLYSHFLTSRFLYTSMCTSPASVGRGVCVNKKLIASALPATARVGRYVVVLVVVAAAVHVVIVVARGWRGGRPLGHARGDLGCHGRRCVRHARAPRLVCVRCTGMRTVHISPPRPSGQAALRLR